MESAKISPVCLVVFPIIPVKLDLSIFTLPGAFIKPYMAVPLISVKLESFMVRLSLTPPKPERIGAKAEELIFSKWEDSIFIVDEA